MKHLRQDGDARSHPSPARTTATVQWEVPGAPAASPRGREDRDEPVSCEGGADAAAEVNLKPSPHSSLTVKATTTPAGADM